MTTTDIDADADTDTGIAIDLSAHGHAEADSHAVWLSYPIRKRASVLVVLLPSADDPRQFNTILTKRSRRLRTSPGMSAFPGGKVDSFTETEWACALREAEEETGFSPAVVAGAGGVFTEVGVTPCYLAQGNIAVRACFGVVQFPGGRAVPLATLCPALAPAEVELAYTIPLASLLAHPDSPSTPNPWHVSSDLLELVAGHFWWFHDYSVPLFDMVEFVRAKRTRGQRIDRSDVVLQGLTVHILQDVGRLVYPGRPVGVEVLPIGANAMVQAARSLIGNQKAATATTTATKTATTTQH